MKFFQWISSIFILFIKRFILQHFSRWPSAWSYLWMIPKFLSKIRGKIHLTTCNTFDKKKFFFFRSAKFYIFVSTTRAIREKTNNSHNGNKFPFSTLFYVHQNFFTSPLFFASKNPEKLLIRNYFLWTPKRNK